MPSSAQSAQQSIVRIQTAEGTPLVITGVTQTDPPVVSFTPGSDPADGTIINIAGIVGMTELNGRAYVTDSLVAGVSFELKGVRASGYTAYGSAGTATPLTMTEIANAKNFDLQPDEAPEYSRTNLRSVRQEFAVGLAGSWVASFDYDVDTTDTGQAELEIAQDDGFSRGLSVTLNSGAVFAGLGFVKSASAGGAPDSDVSGVINVRGTGQPTWFV